MDRVPNTRIGCVLALVAASASAREVVNVSLEFTAPSGCSDRETFASGLRSRSERIQIVESTAPGWIVSVALSPKERGVHGELRLTDEHGESELRAVEGADCAEVVEALSLTAALAIEQTVAKAAAGNAGGSGSTGSDTLQSSTTSGTGGARPPSATPIQTKPPADMAPGDVGLGAGDAWPRSHVSVGVLATQRISTKASFGLSLGLSHRFPLHDLWSPEVTVGVLYVPREMLQPKGELGVGYVGGALHACPLIWSTKDRLSLSPCAVLEVGRLTVHDDYLDVSFPSSRLTGFFGGMGRGRVRLAPHLELEVSLALLAPLTSRRYVAYLPSKEVGHTSSPTWQVGVGWLFGW